jgi:hypothetical protein
MQIQSMLLSMLCPPEKEKEKENQGYLILGVNRC